MRDSNYKSVGNNRAAVTISTTVYDRRALDVTSDRPLVNSLNHLTYLVSSSAKVRETLSTDGGIERLIEILHECHNSNFTVNDNIFNSEKKVLTAWKWTLAFQCLVLIGTRGTETIRQRVVKAGILPIIATVLDNYITLNERTFIQANRGFPQTNYLDQSLSSSQSEQNEQHIHHEHPHEHPHEHGPEHGPGHQHHHETFPTNEITRNNNIDDSVDDATNRDIEPRGITINTDDAINPQQTADIDTQTQIPPEPVQGGMQGTESDILNEFETFQNNFGMDASASAAAALAASDSLHGMGRSSSFFNETRSVNLTSEDYENLSIDQLLRLIRTGVSNELYESGNGVSIKRRYLILLILKKLRDEKENELLDTRFSSDSEYDMDNSLQFLTELLLQDGKTEPTNFNSGKPSPRNFTETGVVIPRDDDIVWALQLLAYISKYPYLKDVLQNTHLVIDMSVRDKQLKLFIEKQLKNKIKKGLAIKQRPTIKPKSRKSKLERSNDPVSGEPSAASRLGFSASASNSPQMINSINSIQDDNFILDQDKLELDEDDTNVESGLRVNDTNIEVTGAEGGESDPEIGSVSDSGSDVNSLFPNLNQNRLGDLFEAIEECDLINDPIDRELALYELHEEFTKQIDSDCKKLSILVTKKRLEQKEYLKATWNYDNYDHFNVDDQLGGDRFGPGNSNNSDYDDSLFEYRKANLFPIVEKFTFLAGTDMYYWSGVIMRNSCRRNEFRGGVRQCGNLDCGKWETYPREFSKCRRCKRTKYCSRECQMKAWHSHRNWCIPSTIPASGANGAVEP